MFRRLQSGNRPWIFLLCMLTVMVCSCGPKGQYVGTYKAEAKDAGKQVESVLQLKDNGEGSWKVGDDEVSFSWYIKNDELRVNTKGGGVIVGSLEKDAIRISLPGFEALSFKKLQ
jgi:hypothetical protein